jgi:hypothetical protein
MLHIGNCELEGMPDDVRRLAESFTASQLLTTVARLMSPRESAAPC